MYGMDCNDCDNKCINCSNLDRSNKRLIELLKKENFVLEKRFAESYARGKFRNNAWGIQKIKQGLKSKGIKQRDIDSGIQQIEQEEYQMLLKKLAHAKMKMLRQNHVFSLAQDEYFLQFIYI